LGTFDGDLNQDRQKEKPSGVRESVDSGEKGEEWGGQKKVGKLGN